MAYRAPFVCNNSTGSDSAASGIGPATALTGSAAYCSGSSSTIDLSYDAPDLSGVSVGDCIYIPSLSGTDRCFLEIVSIVPFGYQITVSTTIALSFSFYSWAIGGKRAFGNTSAGRSIFDSNNTNGVDNISVEIEYTGTDYPQDTGIIFYENVRVFGTGSQMPKLKLSASSLTLFKNDTSRSNLYTTVLENLWFVNDNSSTFTTAFIPADGINFIDSCKFGDTANTTQPLRLGVSGTATDIGVVVNNCEFATDATGVAINGSDSWLTCTNSTFAGMPNAIISSSSTARVNITSCTFSNVFNSIVLTNCQMAAICNNSFVNDTGVAIKTKSQDGTAIFGNVFVGCTTGIDHASTGEDRYIRASRNYWQGNTTKFTSADYDTVYNIMSDFDEDLASDPFTDKANDDR